MMQKYKKRVRNKNETVHQKEEMKSFQMRVGIVTGDVWFRLWRKGRQVYKSFEMQFNRG